MIRHPRFAAGLVLSAALALIAGNAASHGDVTPQAVDVSTLKPLGDEMRDVNPYRDDKSAITVGASAYNQNCARCHGLGAVSGGIAPDLRKLDIDPDTDVYFRNAVLAGRVRNGAVYMPPYAGILSQEAIWAIKAYLETRRASLDE